MVPSCGPGNRSAVLAVESCGRGVGLRLPSGTMRQRRPWLRGWFQSYRVFMSAGTYAGHAQLGATASFFGAPTALVLGGCIGSAAVLIVAKFAASLRRIDR